jgi:hypothetical protein
MRKWAVVFALLGSLVIEFAPPAAASDTPTLVVPLVTVVLGDPGSVHRLVSGTVPTDLVARQCTVSIIAENNESVRHGTTLILSSGASTLTVPDVEADPDMNIRVAEPFTLGQVLQLSVVLGPEGAFSGGAIVSLDCPTPPPTTTTPPTTTAPPTTNPVPVTTTPVPAIRANTPPTPVESPSAPVPVEVMPRTTG